MRKVTIFTLGLCEGDSGIGGIGIIRETEDDRGIEISQGYQLTTAERMEIMAVLVAIRSLVDAYTVSLVSHSKQVIDYLKDWQANGWSDNPPSGNLDLWELLATELTRHQVTPLWVEGHLIDMKHKRCRQLAIAALEGKDLAEDTGYKPSKKR